MNQDKGRMQQSKQEEQEELLWHEFMAGIVLALILLIVWLVCPGLIEVKF